MAEKARGAATRRISDNAAVKALKAAFKFCLDNWLVLGFGVATLLAYFFPGMYRGEDRDTLTDDTPQMLLLVVALYARSTPFCTAPLR
jgi:hypothetical protein